MTPEEKKLIKARKLVDAVNRLARKQGLNFFIVTDGASGISNNGNPAVRNAREAQIKWELEHGADPYEDWSKKAESYSLKKDPTYEDALKVFDKLDFDDRANLVPRHPDFLRKVPDDTLFDRQVVVDGKGDPVGFQEFYSRKDKKGRRLPPHNIIAVAPEARGNGLARIMAEAAIRKARKEKVKRLLWEAFADNEPSIRAALSAGFEDATPKMAKGYRKLVYDVEKNASSKNETYESGEGEVESYTPDKTEDHDEIVLRLKNGKKIVISNNTRIGIRVIPAEGDHIGYNGYHINGTNVVHKVHSNKHQRGGWLEHFAGF
jgi:GNAT superfamily N-acetyltransferase